jgi:hypothetical protein
MTTGLAAGGVAFTKEAVVDPVREAMRGGKDPVLEERRERLRATLAVVEARRLRQRMLESAMRLAATDPQTYTEVLAGRKLPMGAVVFGGQPREDLMERLAAGMAQGEYRDEAAEQERSLAELLGM